MRKEPSPELVEIFAKIAKALGAEGGFHIIMPRVCDRCQNDEKEAFPFHVYDHMGQFWKDLCNGCFEELGCAYDDGPDEGEPDRMICPDCGADIPADGCCFYCENDPRGIE